jgi:hypothetical protein
MRCACEYESMSLIPRIAITLEVTAQLLVLVAVILPQLQHTYCRQTKYKHNNLEVAQYIGLQDYKEKLLKSHFPIPD